MPSYNFTGDVAFKTKLLQLLTTNETGGAKQIAPYELSWAGTPKSGWSFGEVQYDLAQNETGRKTFVEVLLNAKDGGGNYIVADNDHGTERGVYGAIEDKSVKDLFNKAQKVGGVGLSAAERQLIDQALQSAYGKAHIDQSYDAYFNDLDQQKIQPAINAAVNPADKAFLGSLLGKLFLYDFGNQFGENNFKRLTSFIENGTVTPQHGGAISKQGTFGVDDLLNFYFRTGHAWSNTPQVSGASDVMRRFSYLLQLAGGYAPSSLDEAKGVLRAYTYLYVPNEASLLTTPSRVQNVNTFRNALVAPAAQQLFSDVLQQYGNSVQLPNGEYDDVLIGDDNANFSNSGDYQLNGRDGNDVLLGEAGNDVLDGGAGDDTLIGGADNDTLNGGAGSDTYLFKTGEGKDTIKDSDGSGKIVIGGKTLTGADYAKYSLDGNKQVWEAADGGVSYIYDPNSKTLTLKGSDLGDGQITIDNFDFAQSQSTDYLGLKLEQQNQIELLNAGSARPFSQDGHNAQTNTTGLAEGLGKGLTCFLNGAAKLGDTLKLTLTGGGRRDAWL